MIRTYDETTNSFGIGCKQSTAILEPMAAPCRYLWGRLVAQPLSSARQPLTALSCQTPPLSSQPSKQLAVLLGGLRRGLRLIGGVFVYIRFSAAK